MIRPSRSFTPMPVLPEMRAASVASIPRTFSISSVTSSGRAVCRSSLLRTGITVRSPTGVLAKLEEEALRALEGARAVAHAVLLVGSELGERLPELLDDEERIVAEPALAARGVEDPPLDCPFERRQDLARRRERDH